MPNRASWIVPFTWIGSVSSGTMRPKDLGPAFMDTLDALKDELSSPRATNFPADSRPYTSHQHREKGNKHHV